MLWPQRERGREGHRGGGGRLERTPAGQLQFMAAGWRGQRTEKCGKKLLLLFCVAG